MTKKETQYDEIHFVIDEVDGENITLQESNILKDLFQNDDILKDSIVALIIQSMEKRRSFNVTLATIQNNKVLTVLSKQECSYYN